MKWPRVAFETTELGDHLSNAINELKELFINNVDHSLSIVLSGAIFAEQCIVPINLLLLPFILSFS